MGLKRGPLRIVSTTEELLDRKVEALVYKSENTAVGIRHADHVALFPQKLALTSLTSGGRSVDIVRKRTQAMEFSFYMLLHYHEPSTNQLSKTSPPYATRKPIINLYFGRWKEWK
jgi:hypothetical protein